MHPLNFGWGKYLFLFGFDILHGLRQYWLLSNTTSPASDLPIQWIAHQLSLGKRPELRLYPHQLI